MDRLLPAIFKPVFINSLCPGYLDYSHARTFKAFPTAFIMACRSRGIRPTAHLLWARLKSQTLLHLEQSDPLPYRNPFTGYKLRKKYRMSSSRFGIGQQRDSNCTPLGLHRIAEKIGGGYPIGTVYKSRLPAGYTWQGVPEAGIAHCIMWLEGMEPGWNQGLEVDSHSRFIYIHGVGDEMTLGKPASRGCLHLAARDIFNLYYRLPSGTLVWIEDCD